MPDLLMKPVHWNAQGYLQAGGHRATGGFPEDWGFVYEEWNNAAHMAFRRDHTCHPIGAGAGSDDGPIPERVRR